MHITKCKLQRLKKSTWPRSEDLSPLGDTRLGKVPRKLLGSLDALAYKSGCFCTSPWDIKFLNRSIWWGASGSSITMTRLPREKPPPKISIQKERKEASMRIFFMDLNNFFFLSFDFSRLGHYDLKCPSFLHS